MSPRPRHQWQADDSGDNADRPSRSQLKRDSSALQEIGESLTTLSASALASLPLSDDLRTAIAEYKRLPTRESKRRHLQYLGRLMRELPDQQAFIEALDLVRNSR